jgi:hypothetical protein
MPRVAQVVLPTLIFTPMGQSSGQPTDDVAHEGVGHKVDQVDADIRS